MTKMIDALKNLELRQPEERPEAGLDATSKPSAAVASTTIAARGDSTVAQPLPDKPMQRLVTRLMDEFEAQSATVILLAQLVNSPRSAAAIVQLAESLGHESEQSLLLVDADVASKQVTRRCDQEELGGMSEVLNLRQSAADSIVVLESGFHLLPAGRGVVSPRKARQADLAYCLAAFRRSYRYVLIAGGTAEGVLTGDLCRDCDATYVMVELGHTDRQQAAAAVARLTGHGARLLGSIVC